MLFVAEIMVCPSAAVMLLSGSCTHDALMNGSPPPPPETVAPVPTPILVAAETNVAGTNSAITVITAKAIVSFFISSPIFFFLLFLYLIFRVSQYTLWFH
jgi:hypothetical protein